MMVIVFRIIDPYGASRCDIPNQAGGSVDFDYYSFEAPSFIGRECFINSSVAFKWP